MVCKKCGAEIKENAKFCRYCGEKVPEAVQEPVIAEETIENIEEVQLVTEDAECEVIEETPVKKKKSSKKPLLIAVLITVVLATTAFLLRDKIAKLFIGMLPEETQLQLAYKNSADRLADISAQVIGALKKTPVETAPIQTNGKVSLEVNRDFLAGLLGFDLGDVNSASVHYQVMQKANKMGLDLVLNMEGTTIISGTIQVDMNAGLWTAYFPIFNEKPLQGQFSTSSNVGIAVPNVQMDAVLEKISQMLPSEEFVKEFLPKYVEIAFKAIDKAESEEKTVEIGGISQEVVVFTVVFDEEMVEKIGDAVFKELKKDKEFKKEMKKVYEAISKSSGQTTKSWEDAYKDLLDEIEENLNELAELEEVQEGVEFVTWVNSENQVIGIELEDFFKVQSIRDGKEVAYKLCLYAEGKETLEIIIEGTAKKESFVGEMRFSLDGHYAFTLDIEKLEGNGDEGELIMSVTLTPDMLEEMTGEPWLGGNIVLRMSIHTKGNVIGYKFEIKLNKETLLLLSVTEQPLGEAGLSYIPEDVITNPEEWEVDLTYIIQNIVEAGVPQELINDFLMRLQPQAI